MDSHKITGIVGILLFSIIIGSYILCVHHIPPDENGILFKRYDGGIDKHTIYQPGRQIVAPWNDLITYKITPQEGYLKVSTLSKDELIYKFEFNYSFRTDPSKLGFLHEEIAENYQEVVIIPELRTALREGLRRYPSTKIGAMKNKQFEDEIFYRAQNPIRKKHLILESVSIQKIIVPASVRQ